jgi:hypothetical protein
MRRTAGILAIVGAVLWFASTVLPYSQIGPRHSTYHILTALGGQPFREVLGMMIYHWTPVVIVAAAGVWLLDARRPLVFAAGVLFGLGVWAIAQAVASLLAPQDRSVGGWLDLMAKLSVAAAGILAASVIRRVPSSPRPPLPPAPLV